MAWGELKKRVDTWTKWFITRRGTVRPRRTTGVPVLPGWPPARFSVINLILGFWGWQPAPPKELIHLRLSHPFPGTTLLLADSHLNYMNFKIARLEM